MILVNQGTKELLIFSIAVKSFEHNIVVASCFFFFTVR